MRKYAPKISVLFSVYNNSQYLKDSIESIMMQSFTDFELIIIDDGSTDDSWKIISSIKDPRIRRFRNGKNVGLAASLNRAINLARGEFLARMDADDIAKSNRFAEQIKYLKLHKSVDIIGSYVSIIGRQNEIWTQPLTDNEIKSKLLFDNAMAHPTIMMRSKVFKKVKKKYDPLFRTAQDYNLWVELLPYVTFGNIPKVLVEYRVFEHKIRDYYKEDRQNLINSIRIKNLQYLGIPVNNEKKILFRQLADGQASPYNWDQIQKLINLSKEIIIQNRKIKIFQPKCLEQVMSEKLEGILSNTFQINFEVLSEILFGNNNINQNRLRITAILLTKVIRRNILS